MNDSFIDVETPVLLSDQDRIEIGTITLIFHAARDALQRRPSSSDDSLNRLVTILPSEKKYDETLSIRAEIGADKDIDFKPVDQVTDSTTLRDDYEKLRLAYELSKISLKSDLSQLLAKSLELMFEILPVDRGVVLLIDTNTGVLSPAYTKLRADKGNEGREILLSSTILTKVYYSRTCLITSDACEDPHLGRADSVRNGQIRSVICVPLISHDQVHGILHLDSRSRINSFQNKDLGLVKAISNQTAMAIENNLLIKEVEDKAKVTEQLSRFLAPHLIEKMVNSKDPIRRGGREVKDGTIIFADIRSFTNLSEKVGPSEVMSLLNDYFERVKRNKRSSFIFIFYIFSFFLNTLTWFLIFFFLYVSFLIVFFFFIFAVIICNSWLKLFSNMMELWINTLEMLLCVPLVL